MVVSIDIPLKASEQAIVDFLLKVVFAPRKANTLAHRREWLRHDVAGACKLITWIVQHQRRSLTTACNLVYGNTIVLSQQVARLLNDALRAREIVAFSNFMAEEEERRRRTREQMEKGLSDDLTTPKKKRRSKAAVEEDDHMFVIPASPLSTALRQNITMPDVFGTPFNDNIRVEDDLLTPTVEEFEMIYGMLRSENGTDNRPDLSFIDKFSSDNNQRADIVHQTMDYDYDPRPHRPIDNFEFDRPNEDFIREQLETPTKPIGRPLDDDFTPHAGLADILRFGGIRQRELSYAQVSLGIESRNIEMGQRRSMEDEMEDARHRGHADDFMNSQQMAVPRLPSEQIELDEISDLIIPPNETPKTPRRQMRVELRFVSTVDKNIADEFKQRLPMRLLNDYQENYSDTVFKSTRDLLRKPPSRFLQSATELLTPLPLLFQRRVHPDLLAAVPGHETYNRFTGAVIVDEEEDEEPVVRRRKSTQELEPIDLSDLKFMECTPLKERTPVMSPIRPQEPVYDDFLMEQPRREEQREEDISLPLQNPHIIPTKFPDVLMEESYNRFNTGSQQTGSNPDERTADMIREEITRKLETESPYSLPIESFVQIGVTTRREAARIFYVALELLKEREIRADQLNPFGPIDIRKATYGSDDLMDLAMQEPDDEEF